MDAIRIHKTLDSDTVYLPELKPLIGRSVEITVREAPAKLNGVDPYHAFLALAGQDAVDPDAYIQLRTASAI